MPVLSVSYPCDPVTLAPKRLRTSCIGAVAADLRAQLNLALDRLDLELLQLVSRTTSLLINRVPFDIRWDLGQTVKDAAGQPAYGLSVASGRAWHGHNVLKGDVLFVATEGASGVGRLRIPAWFDYHQISERRAYLYPREIRLDVAQDVSAVIQAMNATGRFRLTILDIFGGTMAGSEVEDKTARAWVHGVQRIVRETGASVLTVAHTGWQDDTRARRR